MLQGAGNWVGPSWPLGHGQHCMLPLQVISDGVPLVLALVPHRQPHSFMTQGSPDLLVSALSRAPLIPTLLNAPNPPLPPFACR